MRKIVRTYCCCISNLQACKIIAITNFILHSLILLAVLYTFVTSIWNTEPIGRVAAILSSIIFIIVSISMVCDALLYFGSKNSKKWMLGAWLTFATLRTIIFVFMIQIRLPYGLIPMIMTGISTWTCIVVYGGIKEIPSNRIQDKYKVDNGSEPLEKF